MTDEEDDEEDIDDDLPDFSKDPTCTGGWTYTIAVVTCPHCEKRNYVDLGDLNDQTAYDIEVLICWNCEKKAWLNSDIRDESQCAYDCMDAAMDGKGKETP